MLKFILSLVISGIAVALAAYFTPGVEIASLWTAIIVAVVFGLVNALIGTLLRALTLPLNFLTLGLVSFIITILMVFLTDRWIDGFTTSGWISAAVFAVLLGLIN
jgi:putative membrane protein